MAKVEKILKTISLLKENPKISVEDLAVFLKIDIRTVYRYINQLKQVGILTDLEKNSKLVYDEINYLKLALSQSQLSLLNKLTEKALQSPKELNESELQTLKQTKELISKALWFEPEAEAAPASINFLFEPISGKERADGEVSLGFVGNLDMSNPLQLVGSINVNFLCLIFSSLFTYPKGKPEGLLVNSWEVSDDLLTWNFELKEGVKFHNGKELTAEDVIFTYKSIADPKFRSPQASLYSGVSRFEAISRYKFQVKLNSPNIAFSYMLGIPILPKEVLQGYRRLKDAEPEALLIGSGPFKFESFPQADTMILKANEDYFEEGYPHLEKVILKAYPTSRNLFNACASKEVDVVIFGLTISELEQLGKTIPFQLYPLDMHAYYALLFNMRDNTFSDIRVRKAISHAIDRESLIRRQLRGYGRVPNGPLPPSSWAHNDNLQPVKYNIELAKSLLVEAGWREKEGYWQKSGKRLNIEIAVARDMPDLTRLAIGLKSQLSKLKVKVKLRYINSNEIAPNAFEASILLINGTPDPDKMLWNFWHSESKININLSSYQNPEVDELLNWGRKVASFNTRKAIYEKVQEIIVADYPAAFLCTSVCFLGSNYTLQNADEFLKLPDLFSSIKSWIINKRAEGGERRAK